MSTTRTATLSRSQQERLPYPLGLYWVRAQQAGAPLDVYLAAEGALVALSGLLLAEAMHAAWPDDVDLLLRGGPERRGLEKLTFGARIALLRALVRAHAAVTNPILNGVGPWWAGLDGPKGPLQRMSELRNAVAHRGAPASEGERRTQRQEALRLFAAVFRGAAFLRECQVVHVEGSVRTQRGRNVGTLRRLLGAAPYVALAADAEWPPREMTLEEGRVYLGSADGTRWLLHTFLHLEPGSAATGGHPRPCALESIDRRGRPTFIDPVSGDHPRGSFPDAAWEAIDWHTLLDARTMIVEGWVQALAAPHTAFVFTPPSDLADGLRPGMELDNFRLIQKVGEGGAAAVWEVKDSDTGDHFALKVMKSASSASDVEVRRFEQEVATMRRLRKDGCTRVVGPVESFRIPSGDVRRVVMRMPLLRTNLKDHAAELRAAAGGAAPALPVVVAWLHAGLEALAQLHACGITHRDIKPSNFLLDDTGEVFVSDLGVARDDGRREGLTRTGDVVGTDMYMAPEQRIGARDVGPSADVFALAVSIDELLTGNVRTTPGKGIEGPLGELLRAMASVDADARPTASSALEVVRVWSDTPKPTPPAAAEGAGPPADALSGEASREREVLYGVAVSPVEPVLIVISRPDAGVSPRARHDVPVAEREARAEPEAAAAAVKADAEAALAQMEGWSTASVQGTQAAVVVGSTESTIDALHLPLGSKPAASTGSQAPLAGVGAPSSTAQVELVPAEAVRAPLVNEYGVWSGTWLRGFGPAAVAVAVQLVCNYMIVSRYLAKSQWWWVGHGYGFGAALLALLVAALFDFRLERAIAVARATGVPVGSGWFFAKSLGFVMRASLYAVLLGLVTNQAIDTWRKVSLPVTLAAGLVGAAFVLVLSSIPVGLAAQYFRRRAWTHARSAPAGSHLPESVPWTSRELLASLKAAGDRRRPAR